LISETNEKKITDQIIERSIKLFNYTPAERTKENQEWMLRNGYMTRVKVRYGKAGKPAQKK
jgi:hypothetical protein